MISEGAYFRNGAGWAPEVRLNKAELGNARTDQVLSGVTFTSSYGVKITGTHTSLMPNNVLITNKELVPLNGMCYNHQDFIHWKDDNSGGWTCPVCLPNK